MHYAAREEQKERERNLYAGCKVQNVRGANLSEFKLTIHVHRGFTYYVTSLRRQKMRHASSSLLSRSLSVAMCARFQQIRNRHVVRHTHTHKHSQIRVFNLN